MIDNLPISRSGETERAARSYWITNREVNRYSRSRERSVIETHHTKENSVLRHACRTGETWAVVGILLAALLATAPAMAQQAGGHRPSPLTPEDRAAIAQIFWHRAQASLGLTEQQVADIRALLEAQRATARTSGQSLGAARTQLRTLLERQTPDSAAIQTVATQIKTQQAALFDARLQTRLALRAKLTPEQWQQWRTLRTGMAHGRMHRAPGFGPGM
jgi:Spy/CpxP family protein refolding chaperone